MRHIGVILVGLAVCACSGEDAGGSPLEGTWGTLLDDGCLLGMVFDDGAWEGDYICELEGGGIGIMAQVGTYEDRGDEVRINIEWTSCLEIDNSSFTAKYDFTSNGALRIGGTTGLLVLEPIEAMSDGTGATARFGCWDSEFFTPGELVEL